MFKRLFLLFSPKRTFAKMVESFLFISFSSVARLRAFPWAQRYHFYLRIPSAWHRVWQRTELNKCLQKVENSNSNNISLIKSFDPPEIIFSLVGTECSDHILPWIIVICECFFFFFLFHPPTPSCHAPVIWLLELHLIHLWNPSSVWPMCSIICWKYNSFWAGSKGYDSHIW